jgi:ATP-dependent helicase/nuclease subunit A
LSAYPQVQELEKEMFDLGLFRFDDLEFLSLTLLEKHPAIRRKLQNQFQALLIDEFQDTSQAQWNIFQQLIGQSPQKLFVVGDPKQSIYSFRHADVSLFFEVAALTQKWDGLITELNTNFRTQSTLISDINRISETLFSGSAIPFQPMVSGKEHVGAPLSVVSYETLEFEDKKDAELSAILKTLKERIDAGYSPGDITLLFRMGDRIELYASQLRACGLSVDCTQTLSLFSHYDILDLIHYLKALHNPKDTFSLFAFLFSPWVGLPLNTLATLRDEDSPIPLEERLKHSCGTDLTWFYSLAEKDYLSVREALFELCAHSDYFPKQAEAFYEWLKPLCEKHYSLPEALRDIELWKREDILFKAKTKDSDRDSIKLMTVHASKGLEFEHVFLVDNLRRPPNFSPTLLTAPNSPPGMRYQSGQEKIQCPNYEQLKTQKEQLDTEESHRILYVALTRAKSSLTLFLPKEKKGTPNGSWAQVLDAFQSRKENEA